MAFHLQTLYGTEHDRVNCPFYYKIGACTFGERCARLHNKPTESQTIILPNVYHTPYNQYGNNSEPLFDVNAARNHLDDFYEDIFVEMEQFGEIEEIYICRNLGEHLVGNVYVKFYEENDSMKALEGLRGRYYAGRPVGVELSPVTDFREARCRQYDVGECNRGGFCNFMHLGEPSRELADKLYSWQRKVQRRKRLLQKKEDKARRELEGQQRELEREQREKERELEREKREKEREQREKERSASGRVSRWDRKATEDREKERRDTVERDSKKKRFEEDGGKAAPEYGPLPDTQPAPEYNFPQPLDQDSSMNVEAQVSNESNTTHL